MFGSGREDLLKPLMVTKLPTSQEYDFILQGHSLGTVGLIPKMMSQDCLTPPQV